MRKEKNAYLDAVRGVAMLLVVLGHTITGCTDGYENSIMYNMIWLLQMPLFFTISGYITVYSRPIMDGVTYRNRMVKRCCGLLIPYVVWTFLVRGLFFGESTCFDLKYLIYHLDSGYWFLISLCTISIMFMTAQWFSSRVLCGKFVSAVITTVFTAVFAGGLLLIGWKMGMSFLNIKQTVYYTPFFVAGYLAGNFREEIQNHRCACDILVALCTLMFVYEIVNCSVVDLCEDIFSVVVRFFGSLFGCVCVFGLLRAPMEGKAGTVFEWIGTHTLEIYLTHYLFLCILPGRYLCGTAEALGLVAVNFLMTLGLTVLTVVILSQNRILKKVLFFGK